MDVECLQEFCAYFDEYDCREIPTRNYCCEGHADYYWSDHYLWEIIEKLYFTRGVLKHKKLINGARKRGERYELMNKFFIFVEMHKRVLYLNEKSRRTIRRSLIAAKQYCSGKELPEIFDCDKFVKSIFPFDKELREMTGTIKDVTIEI